MAVTFKQQPQAFTPSDNPIMFVFESNNTNLPNFEFLIEVYQWNGNIGNSTKLSTHRVFPTLGNQSYFDASETISNYLNAAKIPSDTEVLFKANNDDTFSIIVNERFGDFTNTANFAISDEFTSWKACLSDLEFEKYNHLLYKAESNDFKFFLTNKKIVNDGIISFSEKTFAYFYWGGTQTITIDLNVFDNDDNIIDTTTLSVNQGAGVYGVQLNAEIWNAVESLNISNAFLLEKDLRRNTSFIAGYSMIIKTPYFPFQAPLALPQIASNCYPLERKNTLFYLNKLGGYDAFVFAQNFKRRKTTNRNTMEKAYGIQTQDAYVFKSTQRKTNYLNRSEFRETLQTNWLSEDTHNLLIDELIESPLVFRFDEDNNIEYLQLTDTSSEYKYRDFETLYQLSINIETSKYSKSARL